MYLYILHKEFILEISIYNLKILKGNVNSRIKKFYQQILEIFNKVQEFIYILK